MPTDTLRNVPVPDELAATRERIRVLQELEAELRSLLIREPELRTGNDWIAEVRTVVTQRTDMKEVKAAAPDLVAEHTHPVQTTRVELARLTEDGEILPARKMRNTEKAN